MKKITIYILIIVGICFLIPIFFTVKFKIQEILEEKEIPELSIERYAYSDFGTIKLLHNSTGEIEEIPLDEYIVEVVSAEMPVNYELEALKAQSVAARTYTIYKLIAGTPHGDADICDSANCCQAWISKENRLAKWEDPKMEKWNKIVEAVNATIGEVVTYDKNLINAFFHSNSGGRTENVSNVWGGTDLPYLNPVDTEGEENYSQYSSEVVLNKNDFINKLKENYANFAINLDEENCIEIKELTPGGRVKVVRFGNIEISGVDTRKIFNLKSAKFQVSRDGENIKFNVIGYGHGVGLSQTGADSLAKLGKNYVEILTHFYTRTEVTKFN